MPTLNGALASLVPRPGSPIIFLGAANKILDGDAVIVIFSRHKMPVIRFSGRVDVLVVCVVKDGDIWVVGIRPLKRDL